MLQAVIRRTGSPAEVVGTEPFTLASLAPGMLRVRMLAAPVNPADLNFIEGTYGVKPELPAVPGIEGCGEITDSRAEGWVPGTRVIFLRRVGTWRTHLDLDPSSVLALPPDLDPLQAAMLKVNPLTAWMLLTSIRTLPPGSWIVQNAANSGVGRCVIQLARELGIATVNLLRRPDLAPELRELGAEVVLPDDDAAVAAALAATGGVRPLLAFNAVGGESALRLLDLLGEGGSHVTYGAMSRQSLKVPNSFLIFRDLTLRGLWVSRWLEAAASRRNRSHLRRPRAAGPRRRPAAAGRFRLSVRKGGRGLRPGRRARPQWQGAVADGGAVRRPTREPAETSCQPPSILRQVTGPAAARCSRPGQPAGARCAAAGGCW